MKRKGPYKEKGMLAKTWEGNDMNGKERVGSPFL